MCIESDRGDVTMDETDTEPTHQDAEGTQEDTTLSPKQTKKMRVEKTGEQQNEQTHNMMRRAAHKRGKTKRFNPTTPLLPPEQDERSQNCHNQHQWYNGTDEGGDACRFHQTT
jgi:hypothetical protein